MAWSDVAANQMVTLTNALTSGFTLKPGQSNPGGTQCMTKNDAFTKYNLATTANTNTVASNQLMRKDYWVAGTVLPYSYTFYYASADGDPNWGGFNTSSEACAATSFSATVYSSSSSIVVGMELFYDQYGTIPLNCTSYDQSGYDYYKINSTLIQFVNEGFFGGNQVYSTSACVTPSVTFSSWFYQSYTTGSQSTSGTVTIAGASATFNARAVVISSGTTCTTNVTINGTSISAYRPTPGTTSSGTITLPPGTYSYSVSITNSTGGLAVAGGIAWAQ